MHYFHNFSSASGGFDVSSLENNILSVLFRRIREHSSSRYYSALAPTTPRIPLPGVALQEITVIKTHNNNNKYYNSYHHFTRI